MHKESDHSPLKDKKRSPDQKPTRRIAVAGAATEYKTTKLMTFEEMNRQKVTLDSGKRYVQNRGRNAS